MIQDKKSHMANVNRTYRHRVEILDYKERLNDLYQREPYLDTIGYIYADIKPVRGRELTESNLTMAETTYRLTTYYRPELATDMVLKWSIDGREKYLQIVTILDISGRETHMEIMAKEVEKPSGKL